jgi:RHS repeat-associated protein
MVEGMSISYQNIDRVLVSYTPMSGGTPLTDYAQYEVVGTSIYVDADNNIGFQSPSDLNSTELQIDGALKQDSDATGKIITATSGQTDANGVPEYLAGYDLSGVSDEPAQANDRFVPVVLEMYQPVNFQTATITFGYSGSDPMAATMSEPAPGYMRLWLKDGTEERDGSGVSNGGDYIEPDVPYLASQLGFTGQLTDGGERVTIYIEGIRPVDSTDDADREISMTVNPSPGSDGSYADVKPARFNVTVVAPTPATPITLSATLAGLDVDLAWVDNSNDMTGFEIQRSTDSQFLTNVVDIGSPSWQDRTAVDSSVMPGTTYYYEVAAINDGVLSAFSAPASVTIPGLIAPILTATADNTNHLIQLSWQNSPPDAASYAIFRSGPDVVWTEIHQQNAPLTSYDDGSAQAGITFHYQLQVTNSQGEVVISNIASAELSNSDPSVVITDDPGTVAEGTLIDLVAVATGFSSSPLTYTWTVQQIDNSIVDPVSTPSTTSSQELILTEDGTYTASVTATDGVSTAQSYEITFSVVPPGGPSGISGSVLNNTGSVSALVDADNAYALYYGNASGSDMTLVGHSFVSENPPNPGWTVAQGYTFNPSPDDYVYVAAWNFGYVRMVMGEFELADGTSLVTNAANWQYVVSTNPNPYNGGVTPAFPSTQQVTEDVTNASWGNIQAAGSPEEGPWGDIAGFSNDVQAIWSDTTQNGSPTDAYYVVYRSRQPVVPNSGLAGWTVYIDQNHVGQLESGDPTTTTDADGNYSFSGLAPGTYWVAEQLQSGWSAVGNVFEHEVTIGANGVSRVNFVDQHGTAAAPTGLQANPAIVTTAPSQIDLEWNNVGVSGATYNVYRIENPDVAPNLTDRIATGISQPQYVDDTVEPNQLYFYSVSVVENGQDSPPSAVVNASTNMPVPTAPVAPSDLTVTAQSSFELKLDWIDNSANEAGFSIQRSTDETFSSGLKIIPVLADTEDYVDTGLVPATTYYYRLCSFNDGGSSSYLLAQQSTLPPGTNLPPTVAIPAAIESTFWTGNQADLSVLGADDGGEANLTYTWSAVAYPPGAPAPTFFNNGTNSAKSMTATLYDVGNYTFQAKISDGTFSVTSSVSTVVYPYGTTIDVTPSAASILPGAQQPFYATALDQFGDVMAVQPRFNWTVTGGGSIDLSTGMFTAGTESSSYLYGVTASALNGEITGSASILVSGSPPPVISSITTTQTSAGIYDISVQATGSSALTFTWGELSGVAGEPFPTVTPNPDGTFTAAFAAPGTYVLLCTVTDSSNLSASENVTITVSSGVTLLPSTLTAAALSGTAIELQWIPDPNAQGYIITRKNPDGTSTVLTPPGEVTSSEPYVDQGLTPGTEYYYTYQDVDQFNGVSDPSNIARATTWGLPATPSGLTVTPVSQSQLEISWDDGRTSNPQITGWDILRATSSNSTPPAQSAFQSLFNAGVTDPTQLKLQPTNYYYDNVSVGGYFWYEIVAYAGAEASSPSAPVSGVALAEPPAPPAPTNVVGGFAGLGRVNLQWQYNGPALVGFDVYRYAGTSLTDDGEGFTVIGATPIYEEAAVSYNGVAGATSYGYTDDQVPAGYYFYKVVAVEDDGEGNELDSDASLPAAVNTTANPSMAPPAPSHATAVNTTVDGQWQNSVTLSWWDNSVDETGFDIYRQDVTASGSWQKINSVTARATSYVDTLVVPNNSYNYFIAATNAADDQSPSTTTSVQSSNVVSVMTPEIGAAPNAPSNLELDGSAADTSIPLQWTAPAAGGVSVDHYVLYRSPTGLDQFSPVSFNDGTSIPSNETSVVDVDLQPNTAFDYRLVAVSSTNTVSSEAVLNDVSTSVAPAGLPPVAEITAPASMTNTGVSVNWADGTSTDNRITQATQVRGIIDDLDGDLQSWSLIMTPVGGAPGAGPITLATNATVDQLSIGSAAANTDGLICMLDPSEFPAGLYTLTVTATASGALTTTSSPVQISIASNLKLGNLTLPFSDLTVNVPGGQPITASRTYDSSQSNVLGDFGYGWSLDASTAKVTTTATPAEAGYAASFQPGDLVYVTLPGGQQYTFQFFPVTASYNSQTAPDPYDPIYASASYSPQFVAVDGSDAILKVPNRTLTYHASGFSHPLFMSGIDNYGPSTLGGDYQLITPDGTSYEIDPASDQLQKVTAANGNVTTYSNGQISDNGMSLIVDHSGPESTVSEVYLADANGNMVGQPVIYTVDSNSSDTTYLDLLSVEDQTGHITQLQYNDPNNPHLLTGVIDATGVQVVTATYNTTGELASLTNSLNNTSSIGNGGFNGTNAAETTTDPSGEESQSIYDQYGNVVRQIQAVMQGSVITGYDVTVTSYAYSPSNVGEQLGNIFQTPDGASVPQGVSYTNLLQSVTTYQTFTVPGTDLAGTRYYQQPTVVQSQSSYDLDSNLSSQKTYLSTSGDGSEIKYSVVDYVNYLLGKPGSVVQISETDSAATGAVISSQVVSTATCKYDPANGNLLSTTDASGVETDYTYTTATSPGDGVPAGLVLTETRKSSWAYPVPVTTNVYYTASDAEFTPGAVAGLLRYSIQGAYNLDVTDQSTSDTAGQQTYYAYDAAGNTILDYTFKSVVGAAGAVSYYWVGTTTEYDAANRAIATWQGVYDFGGNYDGYGNPILDTNTDGSGNIVVTDTPYSGFNGGATLPTSATTYTPDGQTLTTTDQYGGVTTNTYDAAGHLVQTLYPDGTAVRSIYDALGRVIWQTDRCTVATLNSGANATETVYNSLGQVVETYRMSGVIITLGADPNAGSDTSLKESTLTNAGTQTSVSSTVYNAAGQAVETDSPSGLRTGTVYYADGSVEYTGPLNPTAPATWYLSANPLPSFSSYTKNVYDQTDNLPAGAVSYDAVTDPLGHTTKTYMDPSGRTIETRYDDGSLTQTIYNVGDQAISGYAVYVGGTAAAPSIPAGGSETVNIAQHMPGDSNVAYTIDVYDASGNLVDVYQPAVPDPAYGYAAGLLTSPHTHYDYDAGGNEKSMTDANRNTTQFSYDANGNQTGKTLPMNQTSSNIYNQYGQLDHSFDFKGNETKYAYDSQGRVQTISYYPATNLSAADDVVTYTYAPLGQLSTINDSSTGRTDTYSYDASGDMIEDQSVQGGLTQTVYHTYDQATGLLVRTWTADGASNETFTYDTQGRLGTVTSGTQVTTYAYDPNGNLHSTTTVNGSTTTVATNTYDDLNRLTDLTNTVNGTIISEYSYTLDHAGNRIQAVETVDGAMQTVNYTYDADNRLTEEKYTVGGSVTLKIDYSYDLDANRTIETQSGNAATAAGTTTSSYNANNELVTVEAPNGSCTFSYYDANGSLISTATATSLTGTQTTTATYTFNDRNQLVADSVNGNTDSYAYDSNGDRISATTNGTTTDYEFDTASPTGYDQVLAETSTTGAVQVKYVWGMQIVSETNGSTTSLYELDGHGSVRQLVNAGSHAVTDMYYYDAFGNLLASSGSTSNVYRFAGMRLDGWSGAYDDAARYYTPQTGEFISRDGDYGSKNDPISFEEYLYAGADPSNLVDPSGDFPIPPGIQRWIQKNLAKGIALDVIIRALIGIRATYVLGQAYQQEMYPGNVLAQRGVDINRQVFRVDSWPDLNPNGLNLLLRPDIVDTNPGVKTVYEVKTAGLVSLGQAEVRGYEALLNLREGAGTYSAGTWEPEYQYYTIGLPYFQDLGIPGPSLQVRVWNAGGGVIAYDAGITPELIAIALRLSYEAFNAIKLAGSAEALDAAETPALDTLVGI